MGDKNRISPYEDVSDEGGRVEGLGPGDTSRHQKYKKSAKPVKVEDEYVDTKAFVVHRIDTLPKTHGKHHTGCKEDRNAGDGGAHWLLGEHRRGFGLWLVNWVISQFHYVCETQLYVVFASYSERTGRSF